MCMKLTIILNYALAGLILDSMYSILNFTELAFPPHTVTPPPTMILDSSKSRAQTTSATTNPEIAKLKQEIEVCMHMYI